MATLTRVRGSMDPIAYQRGQWEVAIGDERWFGPDTLRACLEAQQVLEPIAREGHVPAVGPFVNEGRRS